MASAQKADAATDASPPTLEAMWTPTPAVPRRTEPALPSLAATWAPISPNSCGPKAPKGSEGPEEREERDRPVATALEPEAGAPRTVPRPTAPDAATRKPRSRAAGGHPAPDQ